MPEESAEDAQMQEFLMMEQQKVMRQLQCEICQM